MFVSTHKARAALAAVFCLMMASASAETGITPESIVIGQSVPLTGALAKLGTEYRDGANLYFDHVNRGGGIAQRRIKMVTLDDGY